MASVYTNVDEIMSRTHNVPVELTFPVWGFPGQVIERLGQSEIIILFREDRESLDTLLSVNTKPSLLRHDSGNVCMHGGSDVYA